MQSTQSAVATQFRRLHEDFLVLPNVWDAGTARVVENAGAPALATTSAAVAWSHGYADGDLLPAELLLATVASIARVIKIPLSVDFEGGYSDDPQAVGELVAQVVDRGAVGINIEDGSGSPELLCAKIESVKRASMQRGVDLYVNARIDVYLRGYTPEEGRVAETLRRAELYRQAGADGIFVPGIVAPEEIRNISSTIPLPLNVLAWPGLPSATELKKLGVRRLSAGSSISSLLYAQLAAVAAAFLKEGKSDPVTGTGTPYAEMNRLMS